MADQDLGLTTYLAELEQQRASLDIQIAGVKARLGLPVDAPPTGGTLTLSGGVTTSVRDTPVQGRIRPDEFFGMSIPEAIKRYLAIMKQPQSPKAMVDGLQAGGLLTNAKNFYPNVTTALKRLRIAEQVVLTPNGWGLTAWYPNRPKSADEGKKGRGKRKKVGVKAPRRPVAAPKAAPPKGTETPVAHQNGKKGGNDYRTFMSEQRKAGKSMAEVAAEWRAMRAGSN